MTETPAAAARDPKRKRRRRVGCILSAAIALLGLAAAGLDYWLPYMLLTHYKFAVDEHPKLPEGCDAAVEQIAFTTEDGIQIRGWFIPATAAAQQRPPTLIVLHTLGRTRQDMLEFSLPFRREGFNLALIDLRGHGASGGEFFTYGYHEWRDVTDLIDWLERRGGGAADNVVLLGASSGGAVAIAATARDARIRALVTVGTFSDLEAIAEHQTPFLPAFWRRRALSRAERLGRFSIAETSPSRNIEGVRCPVLIVHGTDDAYVPYAHALRLYEHARGVKELHPIDGAGHADMFSKEGPALQRRIAEFLRENAG